jgi:hypothetical protein
MSEPVGLRLHPLQPTGQKMKVMNSGYGQQ